MKSLLTFNIARQQSPVSSQTAWESTTATMSPRSILSRPVPPTVTATWSGVPQVARSRVMETSQELLSLVTRSMIVTLEWGRKTRVAKRNCPDDNMNDLYNNSDCDLRFMFVTGV